MTRKLFSSGLMVVAMIAAIGGSAFAVFRDTEFIPGNTISTGTVDIVLDNGLGQMPDPIVAEGLMPGEFSEWTQANVISNSSGNVKLYFYVIDVDGDACNKTNLEIASGANKEWSVYSEGLEQLEGSSHKIEVTGYEYDPTLPAGETATFFLRAGLDEAANGGSTNKTCSWTGVFLAESVVDEEPPVSHPVSFPEEL